MVPRGASLEVRLNWMGKASLFVFPHSTLFRALGGLPIRRDARANLVEQSAARFARDPALVLAGPAEGTRFRRTT